MTIDPPYILFHLCPPTPAITTLLSMSMSYFSFWLDPTTPNLPFPKSKIETDS